MDSGKHLRSIKKSAALLVALLLIVCGAVGGTLAFLADRSGPVKNTFTPSKVSTGVEETFADDTKTDVKIKNTGDVTAWIRAAVVITWQDKDGNVYGQAPAAGADYTITYTGKTIYETAKEKMERGCWVLGKDGFYYWTKPVRSVAEASEDCTTGVLIKECKPEDQDQDQVPEGYFLNVEILGSGIQHEPVSVFDDNWKSSGLKVSGSGDFLELVVGEGSTGEGGTGE